MKKDFFIHVLPFKLENEILDQVRMMNPNFTVIRNIVQEIFTERENNERMKVSRENMARNIGNDHRKCFARYSYR